MSPRPSPCDGFSGSLPGFVDRELPEEHSIAVERHLDGCPRCQARLRELESVSAVLKAWDSQVPAGPPAPQRLRHAVMARVEEHGANLRRLGRRRRLTALALAASVLVALGAPLAMGLSQPRPAPWTAPEVTSARVEPAVRVTPPAPLEIARLDPEQLAHRPWPAASAPEPGPAASDEEREAFLRGALAAQRELEEEIRFARLTGMRGIWVVDRDTGRRMLVSPEAAHVFEEGELLDYLRTLRAKPYYPQADGEPRPSGLAPADLLAHLLPEAAELDAWRQERRLLTYRAPGAAGTLLTLYRLDAHGTRVWGPEVLDPLEAQRQRKLRLEASGLDPGMLNAVVEGTTLPLLIPAGTLLEGGEDDRVVASDVWLPASPSGRQVVRVACRAVRAGPRRGEEGVRLTPWIAGPSMRALLARGADAVAVLEQARRLRGAAMGGRLPLEWSLLDLYDAVTEARVLESPELKRALASTAPGIAVADGQDRLVGLEHLTLRGPGALPTLMRLVHGFEHEARVAALAGATSAQVVVREPLAAAFERLRADTSPLMEPPAAPESDVPGVVSAAHAGPAPAPVVQMLRVDGRRVRVSALAAP